MTRWHSPYFSVKNAIKNLYDTGAAKGQTGLFLKHSFSAWTQQMTVAGDKKSFYFWPPQKSQDWLGKL
jgi:hypothetical protein